MKPIICCLIALIFLVHCGGDDENATLPDQNEITKQENKDLEEKARKLRELTSKTPTSPPVGSTNNRGNDFCADVNYNIYSDLTAITFTNKESEILLKIGECLLARGADVNFRDEKGYSALCFAITPPQLLQVTEWLLNKGADANGWCNSKDKIFYVIHTASRRPSTKILELLINHGANLESRSKFNYTPLMNASQIGHLEHVKLLVTKGANLLAVNNRSQTALDIAIKKNHAEIVQYLTPLVERARSRPTGPH